MSVIKGVAAIYSFIVLHVFFVWLIFFGPYCRMVNRWLGLEQYPWRIGRFTIWRTRVRLHNSTSGD